MKYKIYTFARSLYLSSVGLFSKPANGVHILSGHFSGKDYASGSESFKHFVDYISTIANLISFEEAISLIERKVELDRPYIALSFDDGFYENYSHIAKVLDEISIGACFFINAGVIGASNEYLLKYIKRVDVANRDFLTWEVLKKMSDNGHTIGSHSLDHFRLYDLNEDDIERQIHENKLIIERKLGIKVNSFAWPYGNLSDISDKALKIIEKYHTHIFSGTNYKFYYSLNGRVINRRHIEPYWPKSHIKYFLSSKKSYAIN